MKAVLAAIALLALGGCQKAPEEAETSSPPSDGVVMAPDAQARMSVKTGQLAGANLRPKAEIYARVVDAGPLAQLESEAASARAAADASGAEAARLRTLAAADQSAAPKAVEAAQAQADADAARAALAERRIGLEWGPGVAKLGPAGRASLLNDIAAGRAALLRIDLPNQAPRDIKTISVRTARDGPAIAAASLGPAITSDSRLQAPALFAVVRGGASATLPAGRVLYGEAEIGGLEAGVIIPRQAMVRAENEVWVYQPAGEGKFVRKQIVGGRPVADGWFVASGFKAGEVIVTDGAGSLLAVERGPEEE
ncbi:MAG: hypothetical protein ABUS57_19445 [Pseudomonadota bacterium]